MSSFRRVDTARTIALIDSGEEHDTIRGGQADIIIGSLGRDVLFGEEGIDRFVFLSFADSPVGGGALDFLGAASFSTASGLALRVVTRAGDRPWSKSTPMAMASETWQSLCNSCRP
ncbi:MULTISPECIES: hypothetical protein [Marinovum]|uniref:hypothetical protein n=1 Tax=Marinovum TaxID=367771 RepID=UPI00237BB0EA|nr:hypothetical protein [Marinovum sp. PR37]MDD9746937.1 hypothetical protein [Marinovum sp. PR37]